ncbi:DNA polymerase III subunit delta [Lachnospiraceae bacterium C1.1]|nr:DNA polymerase III subunit delta [Lachnospiraceae bacterium C1.1]
MGQTADDIKNRTFKSSYLLYGEESYLKGLYKKRFKSALAADGDNMNFTVFSGSAIDTKELIDLADTMPFMVEKRLIIVEESGFFKKSNEELAEYLKNVPEETCIVFIENEVDKRGKMYKAVSKYGCAEELKTPEESQLRKWVAASFQKNGKKIRSSSVDFFIARVGNSMCTLESEMDKLVAYCGEREVIEDSDIEAICSIHLSNTVFDLVDAVSGGHRKKAMELYGEMLSAKEPAMRILFLIVREFAALLATKEVSRTTRDRKAIAAAIGKPFFTVGKYQEAAARFTPERLRSAIEKCVEMEEAVKTGKITDTLSVELIIADLSQREAV